MQKTTLVTAGVAAVVFGLVGWFAGSQSGKVTILKTSRETKPCQGAADCKVDIEIQCVNLSRPTPTTCDSYAYKAEVITINAGNAAIDFDIKTPGFDFEQSDGIRFTSLNNGDKVFGCTPQGGANKKFKCIITGATPSTIYKYSIHIKGLDPTDPWVVNY